MSVLNILCHLQKGKNKPKKGPPTCRLGYKLDQCISFDSGININYVLILCDFCPSLERIKKTFIVICLLQNLLLRSVQPVLEMRKLHD